MINCPHNLSSVVILTGAGISAESGLATFRGNNGLWEDQEIEELATFEAYVRNPVRVHGFYNARRRQLHETRIQPNAAHLALARLDREWPGDLLLVTQNVDDLHDRAGSVRLVHMHGELLKAMCTRCLHPFSWHEDLGTDTACPQCAYTGSVRPDIVWFGEMPKYLDEITGALEACDLFVAIGTSGAVYPAAGFVDHVNQVGRAHTIEINLDASDVTTAFSEHTRGLATEWVPRLVDQLLARDARHADL